MATMDFKKQAKADAKRVIVVNNSRTKYHFFDADNKYQGSSERLESAIRLAQRHNWRVISNFKQVYPEK